MMKLTVKVKGENVKLVDLLNQDGNKIAKLVKNAVIVDLPTKEDKKQEVIDILKGYDYSLFIEIEECGGGLTNRGYGTIVCGVEGQKLRPYYCPRRGHLSCKTHAYFSVPKKVISITGYKTNDIVIQEHNIKDNDILTDVLWEGNFKSLPNLFSKFKDAALAACRKAHCYHCRCVHYADI